MLVKGAKGIQDGLFSDHTTYVYSIAFNSNSCSFSIVVIENQTYIPLRYSLVQPSFLSWQLKDIINSMLSFLPDI